jgi:hypothetical protein
VRHLVLLLVVAALAGCGDDEPTPAATATPPPTATEQPPPEPGEGDEEEARVPARFVVTASGVEPHEIAIPAFLAIELMVVNRHAEEIIARLRGAEPLPVAAGETRRLRLDGRRPGRYPITFGPAGDALLVTGVEVGP